MTKKYIFFILGLILSQCSDPVFAQTIGPRILAQPVPVANGGTGSTTASGARSNLSAAAKGANSDITSLTGLTTALTQAQGGTGATTLGAATMTPTGGSSASLANLLSGNATLPALELSSNGTNVFSLAGGANLNINNNINPSSQYIITGAATRIQMTPTGYNFQAGPSETAGTSITGLVNTIVSFDSSGDIVANGTITGTSILGLTTPLSVALGGTGSTTASGARSNLSAASSGANSDITSLSALTTMTITNTANTSLSINGTATNSINDTTTSTNGLTLSGVYTNNAILINGTGAFNGAVIRINSTAATSAFNANDASPYGFYASGTHTTADAGLNSSAPIGLQVTGSRSGEDIYANGTSQYGVNANGNHSIADLGAVGIAPVGVAITGAHTVAGIESNAVIVDQSAAYATPTTGATVTVATTSAGVDLNPAGTLATLTVVFPSSPVNGQKVFITSTQVITSLTLSASQTIYGSVSSLAAGGKAIYKYVSGGTYWVAD